MDTVCIVCSSSVCPSKHRIECDGCHEWTHRTCGTEFGAVHKRRFKKMKNNQKIENMTTKQKLRTHLIDYDEKRCLELFKTKAYELSEIAVTIPLRYRQDAQDYFFQYCVGLSDILGINQEHEKTDKDKQSYTSNLETILLENANEFPVLLQNSARNAISPNRPVSTCIQSQDNFDVTKSINTYSVKEEETNLGIEHLQLYKSLVDEESKTDKLISGWQNEGNALNREKENAKGDESLKILNTVTNVDSHSKDSHVVETKDDNTEAMLECCEESVDEGSLLSVNVHNDGHARNRLDKTSINEKENPTTAESGHTLELILPQYSNGHGNVCNISELLECIPQLSQYMQPDPKHVTVLKGGTDEEENCIHLSVELADGTVQELKIAGYIPTCSTSEGADTDLKPTVIELTKEAAEPTLDIQVKQEENDHEAASDPCGPSIMNRKLRSRKTKIEIKRKGPGRPKNENIPEPVTNENGERVYICEECMASVKTYNALIVHMRTHTGSRPYHCSYCGKSFTTKGNMKSHEMTGHTDNKPWKCKFCEKCFKEKKVMRIHERIHTGERPYSCSICEKAFNQRSVMLEHMLTHSNNKPHLCDFCGQGFRGVSSLKAHKKRHLGLREFQCGSCERAFICRNGLKRHLLTHTGDRPYACDVCSKAFTRLSYLKEHSNLHTGSKPYECVDCGIAFSDTMSLRRHKKKHKLEKDFPEIEPVTIVNSEDAGDESFTAVQFPEQVTINGEETSIQVLVDENTSMEDFQKLQSMLLSATANTELMINSQNTSKQLYQVVCVNPDTQEVVGRVESQEIIVAGETNAVTSMDLQYIIS